jgi:hypothetical protein
MAFDVPSLEPNIQGLVTTPATTHVDNHVDTTANTEVPDDTEHQSSDTTKEHASIDKAFVTPERAPKPTGYASAPA